MDAYWDVRRAAWAACPRRDALATPWSACRAPAPAPVVDLAALLPAPRRPRDPVVLSGASRPPS